MGHISASGTAWAGRGPEVKTAQEHKGLHGRLRTVASTELLVAANVNGGFPFLSSSFLAKAIPMPKR